MNEQSARLALPFLQPGQAQKEMIHNEALAAIDLLLQASVEAVGRKAPPTDAADGACWIVGAAPTGAWTGHADAIAGWTGGGWRFAAPTEGMTVWNRAADQPARFTAGAWQQGRLQGHRLVLDGTSVVGPQRPPIADPVPADDSAALRASVVAMLEALREHGLIARS